MRPHRLTTIPWLQPAVLNMAGHNRDPSAAALPYSVAQSLEPADALVVRKLPVQPARLCFKERDECSLALRDGDYIYAEWRIERR
jgi:hypothetical protein